MNENSNFKTSMELEIFEQKEILANLLSSHLSGEKILFETPANIEKIVFVASGSSYHCARFGADLFGNIAGIEARAIYSSEFLLKAAVPHEENILYVFITQSGETSDTNEALRRAKNFNMRTLAITNKKGSTIWNASDYKIDCQAGEEKSIAATKSLTTQMFCVTLLVLKFASDKGVDISKHIEALKGLPGVIDKSFTKHEEIKNIAKALADYELVVVTADGISYAIAKEASLKIKETSYICTLSSILGEFMHGHVAILNNKSAQIHVSVDGLSEVAIKNLTKIKTDYKTPLCFIGEKPEEVQAEYHIDIDCNNSILKSFGLIVVCQLLALEIAKTLNRNVDRPHGLNKVVK